jgi:signal transduction histidine kinase
VQILSIKVSDNGKGFNYGQASLGNGLHNLRLRTEQLDGKFSIDSLPGKGTTLNFEIPVSTT